MNQQCLNICVSFYLIKKCRILIENSSKIDESQSKLVEIHESPPKLMNANQLKLKSDNSFITFLRWNHVYENLKIQ